MENMEFEVDAKELSVSSGDRYSVILCFTANGGHILDNFNIEDVVNHFGAKKLLDEIGEKVAREHFDIE